MREYNLTLLTPPTAEPITQAEALYFLRLDTTDSVEIAFVNGLITAAREYCETFQRRAYITQTWEMALKRFPYLDNDHLTNHQECNVIEIPKGNLQSIDGFTYKDLYGTEFTLVENTDFIVSKRGIVGRVSPPYAGLFPVTPLFPLDPIVIKFTCGYGTAADVPLKIKQAMYLLIAYWYDNRNAAVTGRISFEVEFSVKALLTQDRISIA